MLRARWLVSGLLVLLIGSLTSCAGLVDYAATFDGTSWRLESLNGQTPIEGTTITLEFDDGTVGGSGGCNSYSGGVTATEAEFIFARVSRTEMACETAIMAQEEAFFIALGSRTSYLRADNRLGLTNSDNGQVLVFVQTGSETAALP